jgi:very-short-patch-repair endonuclease
VDGDSHFSDGVIRVTNLEVTQQFEGVCQKIREALKP